jgi:hypothetical protein
MYVLLNLYTLFIEALKRAAAILLFFRGLSPVAPFRRRGGNPRLYKLSRYKPLQHPAEFFPVLIGSLAIRAGHYLRPYTHGPP